jgi:isorenieratene synthase
MNSSTQEIIIVGGGLAGLTAALHLAESGLSPVVLEADPIFLGGRVSGGEQVEVNGWKFTLEHAVHGIWSPYRNLQAMLTRHKIRKIFVPAFEETWIFKKGNIIRRAPVGSGIRHSPLPAPLHYIALFLRPSFLSVLSLYDVLTMPLVWYGLLWGLGVDPLGEEQPLEGLYLSDIVRGWAPAIRAFMVGLARNGLSACPEEIPLSGFLAFLRFYTLLRRDSWAFSYMSEDAGKILIEPLVSTIENLGGRLIPDRSVKHLEKDKGHWRVVWEGGSISAKQVILASDSPNTRKILANSPHSTHITPKLYWPPGTPTAIVRVWFDRAPVPGSEAGIFSGDFILDNYFWLHSIYDPYIEWHRSTGGSAIEVHIYGPPELLEEPDASLLARAISDIQSAFPELRGHRIYQTIQRNNATHTLFGLGPKERHLGIETPWENLFCCGDWVRHTCPALFMERAVATGILAANAVLRSRNLSEWKLVDYPQPEPFAVLIEKLIRRGRKRRRRKMLKNRDNAPNFHL